MLSMPMHPLYCLSNIWRSWSSCSSSFYFYFLMAFLSLRAFCFGTCNNGPVVQRSFASSYLMGSRAETRMPDASAIDWFVSDTNEFLDDSDLLELDLDFLDFECLDCLDLLSSSSSSWIVISILDLMSLLDLWNFDFFFKINFCFSWSDFLLSGSLSFS